MRPHWSPDHWIWSHKTPNRKLSLSLPISLFFFCYIWILFNRSFLNFEPLNRNKFTSFKIISMRHLSFRTGNFLFFFSTTLSPLLLLHFPSKRKKKKEEQKKEQKNKEFFFFFILFHKFSLFFFCTLIG